jgi:hypothetical protein
MNAPVESKVKASGWAALLAGFVVAYVVTSVPALAGMADLLQALVVGVLTSLAAGVAGWLAKHTPRPSNAPQSQVPPR